MADDDEPCPVTMLEPRACPHCARGDDQRVWVTPAGDAYHARPDCVALVAGQEDARRKGYRVGDVLPAALSVARVKYNACHVCINSVCHPCAKGRHRYCDPARSHLEYCECARRRHA